MYVYTRGLEIQSLAALNGIHAGQQSDVLLSAQLVVVTDIEQGIRRLAPVGDDDRAALGGAFGGADIAGEFTAGISIYANKQAPETRMFVCYDFCPGCSIPLTKVI